MAPSNFVERLEELGDEFPAVLRELIMARIKQKCETRKLGIAIALLVILTLRVVWIPLGLSNPHGYDSFAYREWTWYLLHDPLSHFYAATLSVPADHLPGDLWFLMIVGKAYDLVVGGAGLHALSAGFTSWIAAAVVLFDIMGAVAIFLAGRSLGKGNESVVAGLVYLFNPSSFVIGSVWGQTDSVSAAGALVSIALAINRKMEWAVITLCITCTIKPQYGLLLLPIIAAWYRDRRHSVSGWTVRLMGSGLVSLLLVATVIAPFDVSLVGGYGRWTLLDRMAVASNRYEVSVLGGHNFWGFLDPLNWPPDDTTAWFGPLSRQMVGFALLACIIALCCWVLVYRWHGVVTSIAVSNLLMLGFFLVMTRMHERYMFPVVGLSILLTMIERRYFGYAVLVNVLCFLNVYLRLVWPEYENERGWQGILAAQWLERVWIVQGLSVAAIAAFVWLFILTVQRGPHARCSGAPPVQVSDYAAQPEVWEVGPK